MYDFTNLADKLKFYRTAILNMEQKQLAEAIGSSVSSISRYEKGHGIPPLDFIVAFADYTNQSVDTLLDRELDMMSVKGLTVEQKKKMEFQAEQYRKENAKKGIKV